MEEKLCIQDLHLGYRHTKSACRDALFGPVNVQAKEATIIALIGRNGVGKSTFLRTLCGMQKALSGAVHLCGKRLTAYTARERARLVSFVSTASSKVSYLQAFDMVAMGRFPYSGWIGQLSEDDKSKVRNALQQVGLTDMANRHVDTLSDGERQRAVIAQALVQDTPVMILDEPTAFLDLPNKYEIVHLLRGLAHQQKKIVIFSTHELSLALQMADTIWVMSSKGMAVGAPDNQEVISALHEMFAGAVGNLSSSDFRLP